jgi:hypothetical protein
VGCELTTTQASERVVGDARHRNGGAGLRAIESPLLRCLLATVLAMLAGLSGAGMVAGAAPSVIRVTLTAQNHRPRAAKSPSVHWWYCVKITTAAGESVASTIHIRIVSGGTLVRRIASISLRKGYDHWCQAIGGEASILNTLPVGRKLIFQAVVTAQGVTVKRNWPIVVRRG